MSTTTTHHNKLRTQLSSTITQHNMSFSSDLLAGQVGIVTGAGSPLGIGRSMVIALAAAGVKAVYACDLNLANIPSLQESVKAAGYATHVEGKLLDVADDLQTVELLKEITKKHGRFDFFFANAGYAKYRSVFHILRVTWIHESRVDNETAILMI